LSVSENVQLAARELVRHLWNQTQVPGRSKVSGAGDDGFGEIMRGFAVPNFVAELLKNDQRNPGIA
jgi:hypothetical protein